MNKPDPNCDACGGSGFIEYTDDAYRCGCTDDKPVEIIHFPKLCPKCKRPLTLIKKMSGAWWYECNRCEFEEKP